LRRLVHPLTGSTIWVEYKGTTVVRKVWNGRANLAELDAHGPAGHLEFLSQRLYNSALAPVESQLRQRGGWQHQCADRGRMQGWRGEFYDWEEFNGRMVLVRMFGRTSRRIHTSSNRPSRGRRVRSTREFLTRSGGDSKFRHFEHARRETMGAKSFATCALMLSAAVIAVAQGNTEVKL